MAVILVLGVSNIFADALSMGVGEYLSSKVRTHHMFSMIALLTHYDNDSSFTYRARSQLRKFADCVARNARGCALAKLKPHCTVPTC